MLHELRYAARVLARAPGFTLILETYPLTGDGFGGTVWRADAPGAHGLIPPADARDRRTSDMSIVTSGYFRAMRWNWRKAARGARDAIPVVRRDAVRSDRPHRCPALLILVALAACYVPARRALRVDPLVALRDE